jgi:hypothetical protein
MKKIIRSVDDCAPAWHWQQQDADYFWEKVAAVADVARREGWLSDARWTGHFPAKSDAWWRVKAFILIDQADLPSPQDHSYDRMFTMTGTRWHTALTWAWA